MLLRMFLSLPKARLWVDQTIASHREHARPCSAFGFRKLPQYFPKTLLDSTQVVVVECTPQPPLTEWGITLRSSLDQPPLHAAGITLRNTFFVVHGHERDESLFFHELIHVLQWQRLGVELFLALYGSMLIRDGYRMSPMEQMAYDLQAKFDDPARQAFDVSPIVNRRLDELVADFKKGSVTGRLTVALLGPRAGRQCMTSQR